MADAVAAAASSTDPVLPKKKTEIIRGEFDEPAVGWSHRDIKFLPDNMITGARVVMAVQTITVDNTTGGSQNSSQKLEYTESDSTGSYVDDQVSASATVGVSATVEGEVGIPLVTKGKVSATASASATVGGSHTWGSNLSTTKTISTVTTIVAAPGEVVKGTAISTRQIFFLPYQCTIIYKRTVEQTAALSTMEAMWVAWGKTLSDEEKSDAFLKAGIPPTSTTKVISYGWFHGQSNFDLTTKMEKINKT